MREIAAYECEYCKKLFRTARHKCKFDPKLKNCFTCANFGGWGDGEDGPCIGDGMYGYTPPYPKCEQNDMWDIELIKNCNYDMQCEAWKQK